jgi:hypothetical protein
MTKNNTIDGINENDIQNYGLSIDEIDSEAVNLIFVATDASGTMEKFKTVMSDSLINFKEALINSKEVDIIAVSRANFQESNIDIGVYGEIKDFNTDFDPKGLTPLYDVIVDGANRLITYMGKLKKGGMRVKAVFAIFSDGLDNNSKNVFADARKKIEELNNLEVTTAFITFGSEAKGIANDLKFQNDLEVGSSASELRKAFQCLSTSVIESSKSTITGGTNFFKI